MDCFWCIKDKKTNAKALKKLCSTKITAQLLYDLKKDLTDCYDCVLAYHSAKQFFLLEHDTTQKELLTWETDRLCNHFKSVLNSKLKEEEDATDVDDLLQDTMPGTFGFGDAAELQVKLSIPLQEILNFPYLLWDKELANLSTEALLSLEEAGSPLILDGKLPGIYLLLIHPSGQVRKWARKSVNFLGSVSCDDYDDLSDVVKWIMGVSEFGLFQCPEVGDDPLTQSSYTILPSHLFVQHPVKEFWLGVCMFLKALEVTTVRLQLVSRGNHEAFIGVIVTALDHANSVDKKTAQGRQSEFWPILHCFVILLERLGSRIWQHISLLDAQMEVFRLITRHPAYLDELKHWPGFYIEEPQASGTSSCDDSEEKDGTTSSSQMVYSWDGRRRRSTDPPRLRPSTAQSSLGTNPRKGKRQTVVFAWFKPYLKSVVDFGEVGAEVVKAVLKYLHGLKAEFLVTSQGYDSTMAALVYCLDHLLKCSLQSMLSIASNLWIPDVIEILKLEPAKPSRAQKLANVFCKSLLGRIVKSGVNVTSLMKWFEDKNKKKDMNNNNNSDYEMIRRLQTLLQKVFKVDPTSPPDTRNFSRERRMIVTPKQSRHVSDTSKKHPSTSQERFSSTPIEQEYKFMMIPVSPTFDILPKPKENIKSPKSPQHSVIQKTIKQSPSRKDKTILDYFNKSSLLDARVDLQKLKVTRKSDNEGNSSDVLVVDSSDDFSSDVSKKERNVDVKLKSSKLSLKTKKGKRKKTKSDDEGLVSSADNSCTLSKKVPSKKIYEKATTSKNASIASSSFLEDEGLLDDHTNDDFLETVCSQFETKPSPRSSSAKLVGQRTTSKESKAVAVTVKTEKYCIVISDDNLSDVDSRDVSPVRGAVDKVDGKPGGLAVVKKEEPSDESWVFVNDESDWKVKVEDDAEMDNIFKHFKIEKSDGSGLDSNTKPKIKIEANQAQVKLEKRGPPWSPAEEDKSKSSNVLPGFPFNDDNDWGSIINVDDDDDDDLLMSCLPVRDSLDTMTCVEADLSELPDECDVMIMEDDVIGVKRDDVADDVINDVDDDVKNDVDDDVMNDDVSDDVIIVATTSGRERNRRDILSVVLLSSDDEAEDYEVKVEELKSADEDWEVNAKRGDVKRHEPSGVSTIPEEATGVDDRKIAVPDYLSPEVAKTNCFGALLSKLKTVYKKTNSIDVAAKQEFPSDENAAADPPGKMVDVEMKDEGEIEGAKTCDEKVDVETGDKAEDNYDEQDMDISTEVVTPKEIEPCQRKLSDAGRNKTSIVDGSVFKDSAKIGIVRPLERSESVRVSAKPLVARANSYPGAALGTEASSIAGTHAGLVSRDLAERQRNAFLKETRSVETKPRYALTVEEFYAVVLKWDPNLLFKTPMKSPNIPNYGKVSRIFASMDHYYKIFKPLLFLEVWAQAVREWKDKLNKSGYTEYDIVVDSVNYFVANFQLIKCKKRIRVEGNQTEMFLQESVLVMIELKDDSNPVRTRLFASVDSVNRERCSWKPGDQGDGTREAGGQYFEFSITLRMLATARRPMVRETLRIIVVTPLVTFIRQWKGLMFLPRSLLARDILSPRVTYCGTADLPTVKDPTNSINDVSYNDSQRTAIERTSEAIRKPYPIPRICFIQGPPGTGKSHTIIGLIKKHLKNRAAEVQAERENQLPGGSSNNTLSQSSGRILLCAPSNAAVDVLVRRLIAEMKTSQGNLGSAKGKNCGSINLVRIGRFSSIHPQVHAFTLDVLSKTEIAKLSAGDVKEEEAVKRKLEDMRGKIDLLEKQCYSLRCCGYGLESQEVKVLNSEVDELVKKKKQIERQYGEIRARTRSRKRQETKIKKDILFSADVICSTLSGSGSNLLYNELLKNTRKHLPFGCVIVDEACQGCELDILIPLQFGSSKLVLVGDPEQLRTTILSQKAQDLLFGQSLYERHYRLFRERAHRIGLSLHSTKDNPIQMLEVQYRMHPDIAAFPSNRVYQGRLRNAKSVTTRPSVCALRPYIVLNICNGKEQLSSNGSICNPVECNLVLEICLILRKSLQEKHFGIITPYRAQLNLLERHLREKGMDKIEVNTVDGFQGREKEVIIMSCVRAHGQAKGIGFLADRQRMNVALTRARYSLVILLNVDSLVTNKDWKACIDDAHQRGLLYDVNSSKDLSLALLDETAKGLGPAARSRSLSDENPPKDPLGEGCRTAWDKITDVATNENEGLRAGVHDPRKVRGGENDPRGIPPGGTAGEKSDKGADVTADAGNVKAASGISDGDYVTGTCTREGTFNREGTFTREGTFAREDTSTREGTLTRENKDRVNVGAEQSDGTKDRSLEKAGDKSSVGRSDQCQSAEGGSPRDPRKRKHGSGEDVGSEVRGGLVAKRRPSIQVRDTRDEYRRDEKKRKIEKGLGSNSDAEREAWDQQHREAHDPIRQKDYGSRGKGAHREESRSSDDGKMTSNEREGPNLEHMHREQISTAFSKRKGESREEERKRKKPAETGTSSSSTAFQRADTKYHKGEPPVWLQHRNEAKNDPKRSGSEYRPTDSDQIASVDPSAPIMSQTSDDFDFDFDEHEPEVGNLETNKMSNYDEPAALGTSIPGPSSKGVVDGDVIDLVMKSGGTFLAQNDPYFNQLACHEKREKHARDVSTRLSREDTTQVCSRKELPGNSPHPTPDEVSSRTASGYNQPTKSVRFQPLPQAHRAHVRENYANRNLDDVIERVNARHPSRPLPPLLDQNDGQALGVRRFHGGARQRVAHGVDRNQHFETRALLQERVEDSSGHHRNRRPPNNLDKIRKGWKKNRKNRK